MIFDQDGKKGPWQSEHVIAPAGEHNQKASKKAQQNLKAVIELCETNLKAIREKANLSQASTSTSLKEDLKSVTTDKRKGRMEHARAQGAKRLKQKKEVGVVDLSK